ncbi:Splicing factor U2af small subunit B [Spatholobus suberectus]|nr:Splicing factor U2af small subunit B [Spatholobus suberectus]
MVYQAFTTNKETSTRSGPAGAAPGLAQDQQDFEDIFTELAKFGKIETLNVCDNLADHMIDNVYVYPLILGGSEKEPVNLLKDNNDTNKEGVLNVLAKAGGTIREQLAVTSRSYIGETMFKGQLKPRKRMYIGVAIFVDGNFSFIFGISI